uniref:UDP-N-acetyl-2-amino-2-deoxyglucuronate dehydrogenase n=1 Tax=Candidatus Kentrum sp. FM TaxID=2126340 RepID=A0A450SRY1_9GAMM|nr:MAG: UDP-N-acetyl-2-amino-2-deoxyglucuronate dehydrogenase [Candidatus Kentron sp. FM]VFJ56631.1 MAG: UDP-N-acetyl-2-amino-2-deoxyglucuronate dehydrogenase [Candidatus Kentron sp. FM]VFK11187.1 MAG: UDP-N-acetyl-2-amino-2-deoxyglucuronate dehydrogenase [Candidatus Kentron sp. FM]
MMPFKTITERKIRIAVVGCGHISRNHFASIDAHPDHLELAAVCDADARILEEISQKYRVPGYQTMEEMLKAESVDVAALCTPSGLHPEQAALAAEFGVDVVTEKPMATRWEDGLRMVETCEQAGVQLFVVKQLRYKHTLGLLRRALSEKRFGRLHLVHLNVFWTRPQAYYDQAKWRGTRELDGGAFLNQASHHVDLLNWLIGPIHSVQAMMSTYRQIETEDTGVLNIRWRDGTLGALSMTMCTYPKNLETSITILGETGTVRIGGAAMDDIQAWAFSKPADYDRDVGKAADQAVLARESGHTRYYRNVIDVLRGNGKPEVDGRAGLESLELLAAAYLSAREGKSVSLPLEQ